MPLLSSNPKSKVCCGAISFELKSPSCIGKRFNEAMLHPEQNPDAVLEISTMPNWTDKMHMYVAKPSAAPYFRSNGVDTVPFSFFFHFTLFALIRTSLPLLQKTRRPCKQTTRKFQTPWTMWHR